MHREAAIDLTRRQQELGTLVSPIRDTLVQVDAKLKEVEARLKRLANRRKKLLKRQAYYAKRHESAGTEPLLAAAKHPEAP